MSFVIFSVRRCARRRFEDAAIWKNRFATHCHKTAQPLQAPFSRLLIISLSLSHTHTHIHTLYLSIAHSSTSYSLPSLSPFLDLFISCLGLFLSLYPSVFLSVCRAVSLRFCFSLFDSLRLWCLSLTLSFFLSVFHCLLLHVTMSFSFSVFGL